jgi:hypothetical protein
VAVAVVVPTMMYDDDTQTLNTTKSFVAGCAAGVTGCIVGHPFDTIKLVQQTSSAAAQTSSLAGSAKQLLLQSRGGGGGGVWAGLFPALGVQVLTSGVLFGVQASVSASVAKLFWAADGEDPALIPSEFRLQQAMAVSSVSCASVSGFLTGGLLSPLVCPLEAIKCRSQVAAQIPAGRLGLRGLYSGWTATVLRCSFGNAAFFGVYTLTQQLDLHAGVGGAIAGGAFWVAAMPFDVVKSRMQTARAPLSFAATFRQAVRQGKGGVRVLYAGLPVTLLRAIPMNAAVLFTYEAVMALPVDRALDCT